jgi:hypothetical protein
MRRTALAALLIGLLPVAAGVLFRPLLAGRELPGLGGKVGSWRCPPDATPEQERALAEHFMTGAPLPPGFTQLDNLGEVDGSFTGRVDFTTGKLQLVVTVLDDVEDLEEARLVVDGVLQATATRANGGVVERADGDALATLLGWIPPVWSGYRVEVEWDLDPGGALRNRSCSVKSPLAFWR